MQSLVNFFKFLLDGVVKALTFAVSAPGMLLTSIITLGSSVAAVISQLSNATSSLNSVLSSFQVPLNSVVAEIGRMPSIFQWIAYLLSLDVAFDGLLSVFGIIFPIVVTMLTFICVTLPLFLVQYYLMKFVFYLAVCAIPDSMIPAALQNIALRSNHYVDNLEAENSRSMSLDDD
mgnify:CR=1 FL=1